MSLPPLFPRIGLGSAPGTSAIQEFFEDNFQEDLLNCDMEFYNDYDDDETKKVPNYSKIF